ncbi:MAG: hypothetical protein U5N55_00565 [Cypionkella sp.]|nr:hypothetical protein [Cypionkella sp.]
MSAAWFDLRTRVMSAAVMVVVGAAAVWADGAAFFGLIGVVCLASLWELTRIYRGSAS